MNPAQVERRYGAYQRRPKRFPLQIYVTRLAMEYIVGFSLRFTALVSGGTFGSDALFGTSCVDGCIFFFFVDLLLKPLAISLMRRRMVLEGRIV